MTVIKSFQHDPLGRQCAEALRIKSIEPSKRINNRKEYHQPGDVEVSYEKNESEEMKKKKKMLKERKEQQKRMENTEIRAEGSEISKSDEHEKRKVTEKSTESSVTTNIKEFLQQMRKNTKESVFYSCNQCDYKAILKECLKMHNESVREKYPYSCDQCEYNANLKESLKSHMESVHHKENETAEDVCSTQNMIEDARARKNGQIVQQCDQCEYKTASKAMLRMHKRTEHRETENIDIQTDIIVVQNSDHLPVVQSSKEKQNKIKMR